MDYDNPEWLQQKYWGEGLTLFQIACLAQVTPTAICQRMIKHGVPRRTISEANRGRKVSPETRRKISGALQGKKHPTSHRGEKHYNWKGGRKYINGYVLIWKPDHPYASKNGYIFEHRLIVEQALGRYLRADEYIHHINGKRDDNRLENLRLVTHHKEPICPHCGWPTGNMQEYRTRLKETNSMHN